MANLVQQIHKSNKPHRSTFDLSQNINFTTCPGMLLPVRVDDCLPNSRYEYSLSSFARTVQMVVPSFARVKAHFDAFFVPYRLLGDDYQAIIVGDNRGMNSNYLGGSYSDANHTLPYITLSVLFPQSTTPNFGSLSDAAGISYNTTSPILFNALGYGVDSFGNSKFIWSNVSKDNITKDGVIGSSKAASVGAAAGSLIRNTLPLQAYQKIYQDFYRNKLWELENKSSYYTFAKDDGSDVTLVGRTNGLFEMRYHDYDKDRNIGVIPDTNNILSQGITQYASTVLNGSMGLDSSAVFGTQQVPVSNPNIITSDGMTYDESLKDYMTDKVEVFEGNLIDSNGQNEVLFQQYSAITQRRLEAFQKFAEITAMNKSDYKHQIAAHFGFSVPDLNSDYVQYIGGYEMPLHISDVENTSDTNQGYLAGKGVINGNSGKFVVTPKEHGCVMIICYIVPQIDWSNVFVNRNVLRFNRFDFAIPEFDNLGFEPVRVFDICSDTFTSESASGYQVGDIVGYLPRYWYYKTSLDVNTTGFSAEDKDGLNFNAYIVSYDRSRIYSNLKNGTMYKAFKSLPSDLNGLFAVNWSQVSDNPFVFTTYINCKATLPLSVDSLPY